MNIISTQQMLTHFGVSSDDLKRVLATALERGGNYADLFFQHSHTNMIALSDGVVNRTSSGVEYGVGIRTVWGDQTGYAYVENTNTDDMLRAARTAASIAHSGKTAIPINLTEREFCNRYPIITPWADVDVLKKKYFVQTLNDRIFQLDSRVVKVSVSLTDATTYILFANSEGVLASDYRPMVAMHVTCVMQQNGKIESGNASRAFRMGAEFLTDELIETLAQEAVNQTAFMFDAVQPQGGEMPVVMAAGGSGILLHEAIGHAFEADFNRKNISIFSDKLGKKICDSSINVVDDGTITGARGTINFDDEGIASQRTYIVKDGILNSYLHDRISAKHYGVAPTGNGRRQSFRHVPMPRMRVTYMESGNCSEEEIISQVKKGVYVDSFTNGQVQIGAGDFTFFVKTGRLIENGKLTAPIKDINVIGNGPKALADITMVANNLKIDDGTWTCGKEGQSAPVGQGLPTVLIKRLIVGGES